MVSTEGNRDYTIMNASYNDTKGMQIESFISVASACAQRLVLDGISMESQDGINRYAGIVRHEPICVFQ